MNPVVEKNALQMLAQEHNRNNQTRPVPPDQRTLGAFIHVGKTGGSTLCFYLRYACISSAFRKGNCNVKPYNENTSTSVSNLTTYFHVPDFTTEKPYGLFSKQFLYNFYIFTLRDPFDRAVSAFLYQHPDNKVGELIYPKWKQDIISNNETRYEELLSQFGGSEEALVSQYVKNATISKMRKKDKYSSLFRGHVDAYTCFHTLDDFAMLLKNIEDEGIPTHKNETEWQNLVMEGKCKEFVKMLIHGYAPRNVMSHSHHSLSEITWNIGIGLNKYQSKISMGSESQDTTNITTSKSHAIFAIRTRFLIQDWINVNEYLGQKRESIPSPRVHIRNSKKIIQPIKKDSLTEEGRKHLCLTLKKEYDVFFSLIYSAETLSLYDRQESLKIAKSNCGKWLDFGTVKTLQDIHGPQWLEYCNQLGVECPTEFGYDIAGKI